MAPITLKPLDLRTMSFGIRGTSILVQHAWGAKAREMMRDKHAGKKTKTREKRDPEAECNEALYVNPDGDICIPGMAFKSSLVTAAHKDLGIEKTLVRKAIFLICKDPDKLLPIKCDGFTMREDVVRVGAGSADLRYRPQIDEWSCEISLEIDAELLRVDDVLTLVSRAGAQVGICENRPEKGGEWGRYEIDDTVPVTFEER